MNESKISVRYAKALFQAALEENAEEAIKNDLLLIDAVCAEPEVMFILRSPVVKTSAKDNLFKQLFENQAHPLSMNFLKLLLKNNRESFIHRIVRQYKNSYNKTKNIREAVITMPFEIKGEDREKLKGILKEIFQSDIELHLRVKPEIIGGFILRVDDEQYNASVRNTLYKLRKKLIIN